MKILPQNRFTLAQFYFTEGSGNVTFDNAGINGVTLYGSPTWSSDTPFGAGNSIVLAGSQYMTCGGLLQNGFYNCTIAFWIKPTTASIPDTAATTNRYFSLFTTSGDNDGLDLYQYGTFAGQSYSGKMYLLVHQGGNTVGITGSAAVPTLSNAWHRIVVTMSLGRADIYIDGVLYATQSSSLIAPMVAAGTNAPLTFGALNDSGPSNYSTFKLAGIDIEGRAWNQSEVTADYTSASRYPTLANKLLAPIPVVGGTAANTFAAQEFNALPIPGGSGNSTYLHIFTVGYLSESIYSATSPDGITLGTATQIIGNGNGGESGNHCGRSFAMYVGTTLHLWYTSTVTGVGLSHNTSADNGVTWGTPTTAIPTSAATYINQGVGNVGAIQSPDGSYLMAVEGNNGTTWAMGMFTASSVNGPWTSLTSTTSSNPTPSLLPTSMPGASAGGPDMFIYNGTIYMLLHCGSYGTKTAVYLAYNPSGDKVTWVFLNSGLPVSDLLNLPNYFDQRADPEILILPTNIIIYTGSLSNENQNGAITAQVSHYFAHANPTLYDPLAEYLQNRGHKALAMRTHAKLILFKLADGRSLVAHASANLRSCKNIEQVCFENDPDLYEFHRCWIDGLFEKAAVSHAT